jgi:hypothetical protein
MSVNMGILTFGDWPHKENDMYEDDQILVEQERDRLMELHCRAEHAAFNVIEGLAELNRIEAEGAFRVRNAFAECIRAIEEAQVKLGVKQ